MPERLMSRGMDNPFPRLKTAATADVRTDCKEYKSGARYKGQVNNHRKVGQGTFIWPNGSRYEGQFMDNVRHGQGLQQWADGSTYEGDFVNDVRHGQGKHTWANGEIYSGKFFKDRRHGAGTYEWPDKSHFKGTFYMDQKEGYGVFTFADGTKFEGLYVSNERHGPGILHHPDGKQDVGLWSRERLVKLCAEVPGAFSIKQHPEVEYFSEEHQTCISMKPISSNRTDVINNIVNPPDAFNYEPKPNLNGRVGGIFSDSLHSNSLAINIQAFDEEFYRDANCDGSSKPVSTNDPITATNNTPSCIAMQRHIIKHSQGQGHMSFNVNQILKGERVGGKEKGTNEEVAEEFLKAAIAGDLLTIQTALNKGMVHVDVSDKNGTTALLCAAVNWHQDIINILLDNGADVNKVTDEGLSALSACHVFYYPPEYFRYNIAEKDLPKPLDLEQEPGYDVNEAVKGILGMQSPKKSRGGSRASIQSTIDTRKITKLREEYVVVKNIIVEEDEVGESVDEQEPFDDRELGTLKVKRAVRMSIDDALNLSEAELNAVSCAWDDGEKEHNDEEEDDSSPEDFDSGRSVRNFAIEVSDQLIDRTATVLSTNEMVVSRNRINNSDIHSMGCARRLAMDKSRQTLMRATIHLLLKRGADPNACAIPMPVLFYAVKAADVDAVRLLLSKGASTSATLSKKKGGLAPLHIACCIPGEEGVKITELLLNSLADPDARATEDDSFLNRNLEDEWSKDEISEASQKLLGGRTPLHIACARDDNYRNACRVVHLLLDHHANPDLLCNGFSPLALAVTSGNDMAIDEILNSGADPCLPLTHGVGSALCIASTTEFEHRRSPANRLLLIDKLIRAGADVLAPIPIGPKRVMGTAVDYAYHMYNADRRIAHMPYHALTHAERETFNSRRKLLAHMGDILRTKAVERERQRLEADELAGRTSACPSANFVYTGAGSSIPQGIIKRSSRMERASNAPFDSHVSFGQAQMMDGETRALFQNSIASMRKGIVDPTVRKPLFRYCYECGRSVGVRLSACTRCKEVYFCSKACKLKAWNARHKEECVRIGGRSPSPGKDKRIDSPTPATDPDKGTGNTVSAISRDNKIKLPPIRDTAPNIFMGKNNKVKVQSLRSSFDPSKVTPKRTPLSRNLSKSLGNFGRGSYAVTLGAQSAPASLRSRSGQRRETSDPKIRSRSYTSLNKLSRQNTSLVPYMKCLSDNYGKSRHPPDPLSAYEENYSNN